MTGRRPIKLIKFIHHSLTLALGTFFCTLAIPAFAQGYQLAIAPSLPAPVPSYKEIPNPKASRFAAKKGEKLTIRVPTDDPVPTKTEAWQAIVKYLADKSRVDLELVQINSKLDFELKLAQGELDFAYMTPLQFVNFNQHPGYHAVAKRKAQPIRGVIFVRADSPLKDLNALSGKSIAFPGQLDFAGSVLPREGLRQQGVRFTPLYMKDSASAFESLLDGSSAASGASVPGFQALSPARQDKLRVLWTSPSYTPYAFAAHPSVPFYTIITLQRAMVSMVKDPVGQALLKPVFIDNGFEVASDSDWHDARLIDQDALNHPGDGASEPGKPKQP